jgi:hypothetical protein
MSSTARIDHTVVSIIGTTFTVALLDAYGGVEDTKKRRYEGDAKTIAGAPYAAGTPAVAGVSSAQARPGSQRSHGTFTFSFPVEILRFFGSSLLRIFDVSRRRVQLDKRLSLNW